MIVTTESLDGYIIKHEDETLAFISFSIALPDEWKAKLVSEFADLLVKRLNFEPAVGDMTLCKMCGKSIRYVGPHWEHLSNELQPRHPAVPK